MLGLALGDDEGDVVGRDDGTIVGDGVGCGGGRNVGIVSAVTSQQLDHNPVTVLGQQLASPGVRRNAAHRGFMGLAQSGTSAAEVQSRHA